MFRSHIEQNEHGIDHFYHDANSKNVSLISWAKMYHIEINLKVFSLIIRLPKSFFFVLFATSSRWFTSLWTVQHIQCRLEWFYSQSIQQNVIKIHTRKCVMRWWREGQRHKRKQKKMDLLWKLPYRCAIIVHVTHWAHITNDAKAIFQLTYREHNLDAFWVVFSCCAAVVVAVIVVVIEPIVIGLNVLWSHDQT